MGSGFAYAFALGLRAVDRAWFLAPGFTFQHTCDDSETKGGFLFPASSYEDMVCTTFALLSFLARFNFFRNASSRCSKCLVSFEPRRTRHIAPNKKK